MSDVVEIREAASAPEFAVVRDLIEQYAQALGVDLKFQNVAHEIIHLSEVHGPLRGCLLLAHQASQAVGCVALRGLDVEVCEVKRLYVRAGLRGSVNRKAFLGVLVVAVRRLSCGGLRYCQAGLRGRRPGKDDCHNSFLSIN